MNFWAANPKVGAVQGFLGYFPWQGDIRFALSELVVTSTKAKYFLFDEDPMFSKRENELIQEYLKKRGCMPPGEGEDDLDDLF